MTEKEFEERAAFIVGNAMSQANDSIPLKEWRRLLQVDIAAFGREIERLCKKGKGKKR